MASSLNGFIPSNHCANSQAAVFVSHYCIRPSSHWYTVIHNTAKLPLKLFIGHTTPRNRSYCFFAPPQRDSATSKQQTTNYQPRIWMTNLVAGPTTTCSLTSSSLSWMMSCSPNLNPNFSPNLSLNLGQNFGQNLSLLSMPSASAKPRPSQASRPRPSPPR